MKLNTKGLASFLVCSLALSSSVFAATYQQNRASSSMSDSTKTPHHHAAYKGDVFYKGEVEPEYARNHFEGIGALGIAKLDAGNSYLGVTQSETDSLVQTNSSSWDAFGAQLGGGYIFNRCHNIVCTDHVQWFTAVEPQVNLYYLASNSIKGNVIRFNNPNFNQMSYDIPLHSTRLMLDGSVTVVSWRMYSFYLLAGIGTAWNSISYHDRDNTGGVCTDQGLSLRSRTSTNFAWEWGPGILVNINKRLGVSFEYLFTDLGTVKTSAHGSIGTVTAPVIVPAHFRLNTQTALLGLHVGL